MNEYPKSNKNLLALSAASIGLVAVAAHAAGGEKEASASPEIIPISVKVTETQKIEGSEEGWLQGPTERAIEKARKKAIDQLGITDTSYIQQIMEYPTYTLVQQAVEKADVKAKLPPDEGDLMSVTLEVGIEDEKPLVEVDDAEYIDIRNNQQ